MLKSNTNIHFECYSDTVLLAGYIGGLTYGTMGNIITESALGTFISASTGAATGMIIGIGSTHGTYGPVVSALLSSI